MNESLAHAQVNSCCISIANRTSELNKRIRCPICGSVINNFVMPSEVSNYLRYCESLKRNVKAAQIGEKRYIAAYQN